MKRSQKKIITTKSKILKYMRSARRVSQEEAAQAAGCTAGSIGHYENGRMGISEDRLKKLLKCYEFSYDDFLEFINGRPLPILSVRNECVEILNQINNEDALRAIYTILKNSNF